MSDSGFRFRDDIVVKLVDTTGSDESVARAARASVGGDAGEVTRGFIDFLMKNRHGSPFEHNLFTFYVECPIFVSREIVRHRVGMSFNELSGRYAELPPHFYVPHVSRDLVQVGKAGEYRFESGDAAQFDQVRMSLEDISVRAYREYRRMMEKGIAREVARMVLPVSTYTAMYVTCNARSLMHFLSLRTTAVDSAYPSFPQAEIEVAARQMEESFMSQMPITWLAFDRFGRVAP